MHLSPAKLNVDFTISHFKHLSNSGMLILPIQIKLARFPLNKVLSYHGYGTGACGYQRKHSQEWFFYFQRSTFNATVSLPLQKAESLIKRSQKKSTDEIENVFGREKSSSLTLTDPWESWCIWHLTHQTLKKLARPKNTFNTGWLQWNTNCETQIALNSISN